MDVEPSPKKPRRREVRSPSCLRQRVLVKAVVRIVSMLFERSGISDSSHRSGFEPIDTGGTSISMTNEIANAVNYARPIITRILRKMPHDVEDVLQQASLLAWCKR